MNYTDSLHKFSAVSLQSQTEKVLILHVLNHNKATMGMDDPAHPCKNVWRNHLKPKPSKVLPAWAPLVLYTQRKTDGGWKCWW